jgi:hypothetical protein
VFDKLIGSIRSNFISLGWKARGDLKSVKTSSFKNSLLVFSVKERMKLGRWHVTTNTANFVATLL